VVLGNLHFDNPYLSPDFWSLFFSGRFFFAEYEQGGKFWGVDKALVAKSKCGLLSTAWDSFVFLAGAESVWDELFGLQAGGVFGFFGDSVFGL
jgi:hypothetical protein